jgi:hypothetical protein
LRTGMQCREIMSPSGKYESSQSYSRWQAKLVTGFALVEASLNPAMLLLVPGILFTAVCWYFAWSHIGLLSEYSFFPLWVGYILLVNGLSEVIAGTSLLRRMRWSFLWLFIVSIPMW